jgi:hypothetical protein
LFAIYISCVLAACAARKATAPPPAAPTEPTAPAADPPTAPAADTSQPLYRWYCFADVKGAGTDCTRSLGDCQKAASDWANDDEDGDGVGDNQSTPCSGQQAAFCYSYVPDDAQNGQSLTLCQQTMDSCHTSAGVSSAKPNTLTDCAETQ